MWKVRSTNNAPTIERDSQPQSEFASGLDCGSDDYASVVVDRLLDSAIAAGASDIHLDAANGGTLVRWRVDGTLVDRGCVPHGTNSRIVNRLKALANLLTYRTDVPQEGRMVVPQISTHCEARVVTLPTLHGERVVIRLATEHGKTWLPHELGLPDELYQRVAQVLELSSGVVLVTGPAGSGKTTTACACLRAIAANQSISRSIVTLEDPIEITLPGVAQSQISPAVGYDWAAGLKALLRQDPEVMLVGEIRDAETAQVVFQAAMTGQLVFSTMHALRASEAVSRLLDMKVPAHQIRSSLNLLLCQRLVRRLCACRQALDAQCDDPRSEPFAVFGCDACGQTGYRGRLLLAEALPPIEDTLARAIADRADSRRIQEIAAKLHMRSFDEQIERAVASGESSRTEIERHFATH